VTVRVVVADDSEAFRDAAADVIAAAPGFELVETAESGERAIALAEATRPDLVLLDLRMPGLGGLEAARRIRDAGTARLVVVMTVDGDKGSASLPVLEKRTFSPAALRAVCRRL
jgi:DNA-binding NarL/FixJ family response regulator